MKYTRKYQDGGKVNKTKYPRVGDAWDDYLTFMQAYGVNDFGLSASEAINMSIPELKARGVDLDKNGLKYRNAYIEQRMNEYNPNAKRKVNYNTYGTNPHATYPEFKKNKDTIKIKNILNKKYGGNMRYTGGHYATLPKKDWGGALTGAGTGTKMGASIGSIFGPIGGLVGGGVGAIFGGIFGNSSENKRLRKQKEQDRLLKLEEDKFMMEDEKNRKKQLHASDTNYLNNFDLVESNSLYMKKGGWIQKANASIKRRGTKGVCTGSKFGGPSCRPGTRRYALAKTFKKMAKNRADGGKVLANGKTLDDGNKLLTLNGRTTGSHETGQNIPLKKKGRVLAYAEPGEVLVNDKDMPMTPFVLSKRIGRNGRNGTSFADEFLSLENMKNIHNKRIIEDRQANIIRVNNKVANKNIIAKNGVNLTDIEKKERLKSTFSKISGGFETFGNIAGTVGNLLMTNKTLNRQRGLINDSLNRTLAYKPTYAKNYLLSDQVDVSDQTSAINQGYASSISGLSQIDPAIASALKNTANLSRVQNLNSVYGNRNREQIGLRNQNTMNIMNTNAANTDLSNQTSLMKLNARIAANEQFGDIESTRVSNIQGALGEYNTMQRDSQALGSLRARWKDSIGRDAENTDSSDFDEWFNTMMKKRENKKIGTFKCGGRIRRREHTMKY